MPTDLARRRAAERIEGLSGAGLDVASFWRAATGELERGVAFDWRPCWFTLDPASLVLTSHLNEDVPVLDPAVFHNEYVEDDVNKMADLATSGLDASTLERATGGDPRRSARYRNLFGDYGLRHELVAVLRSGGAVWGSVTLYRYDGREDFDDADLAFVRAVSPALARGAMRGLLVGEATDPAAAAEARPIAGTPGVVLATRRGAVEGLSGPGRAWLTALGWTEGRPLPDVVAAVAAAAFGAAPGEPPPAARVRTRAGTWADVHASPVDDQRVALVVGSPSHDRLGDLLMAAHGLTARERDVTMEVLRGHDTASIAARLFLSPHTVQDHLKSIFAKTGARTRRELLATVFFGAFEPRVRDNEERVPAGRPIVGGPKTRDAPTAAAGASSSLGVGPTQ